MLDMILLSLGILSILFGIASKIGGNADCINVVNVKSTDLDKISDIIATYNSMKLSIEQGHFNILTALQGKVSAQPCLISPLSQTACIYYKAKVYRLIGESRYKDKLFEKEHACDFYLTDNTGSLLIQHKDIKVRLASLAQKNLDEFRHEFDSLELPNPKNQEAVVGYQLEEYTIPIGTNLYLYGEACDRNGELMLASPLANKQALLVSNLSKPEYIKELQNMVVTVNYSAPILILIGGALLAYVFVL